MQINNGFLHLVSTLLGLLHLATFATAELKTIEFSFPNFKSPENDGTINIPNATDVPSGRNVLFLPKEKNALSVGWVIYEEKVQFWDNSDDAASFSTEFTFSTSGYNASTGGSGLAFLITPDFSIGDIRGYLGIFSSTTNASTNNQKIAVEIDVFKNPWDPSASHIGLDVNSIESVKVKDYCPVMDNRCTYFTNKGDINVWIDYMAESETLEVRLAMGSSSVKPTQPDLQFIGLNLPRTIRNFMYVGFSAATGSDFYPAHTFRLRRWSFKTTAPSNGKKNILLIAVLSAAAGLIFIIIVVLLCICRARLRCCCCAPAPAPCLDDPFPQIAQLASGPRIFTYRELSDATKGFSENELLGQGGFGKVFRGVLRSGTMIAVKKISEGSDQGEQQFVAEVSIISNIRHRSVVQLQGWCHEQGQLILVYDYMPNGGLDQHLYASNCPLNWTMRYNVIVDLASALAYLHEELEQCVIHRDIKASNVMLDRDFKGRLGDFGLAKSSARDMVAATTKLAGTMVYMAPELPITFKPTTESDVYSFGILALEVICRRRPFDGTVILLDWVWEKHEQGELLQVVDPGLNQAFDRTQAQVALSVALMCANPNPNERLRMQMARQMLIGEVSVPPLPANRPFMLYSNVNSEQGSCNNSGFHSDAWNTAAIENGRVTIIQRPEMNPR
ncbi:L-type lectin-domain containing receptor kinase IX.1 [Physcomitrium patens]|uniref:non-specific serine/threonine protein kinase n=1 Tax=Physcomitrium patens TaxID=3218 RepID=A9STE4_PHYPA|nr:probable L-type lectin-domain containing receptor kinase S.7 [Physcomitrium patens]PNR54166.1 hypothetical protein PHYPA_007842 [Physcomitrium patens]|eukprot:XP_024375656.1 probable L-type lectin-domain containing receptor kinase S.7 [Physcomitrella patens]